MARSILLATQAALRAALGTNVVIGAGAVPIYDTPPAIATLPYIIICELTEVPDNTHDAYNRELTATIHCWTEDSETAGSTNCKSIVQQIAGLLDHGALTISGGTHRYTKLEMNEPPFREADGRTWHGVTRYRIGVDGI